MGAHPYWYFIETNTPPEFALQLLRQQEFRAGRYHPVIRHLKFPIGPKSPRPGPSHESIDDVMSSASEEGTRSILDIAEFSDQEGDLCTASMIEDDQLTAIFGTDHPTATIIESSMDSLDDIQRGTCKCCKYYSDTGQWIGYFFIGFSFD